MLNKNIVLLIESFMFVLFFLRTTHSFAQNDPIVQIETGLIIGTIQSENEVFLGIPYAQPPVADLRWKAPLTPLAWSEPRETKSFGNDCMQLIDPNDTSPLRTTPSEDCLYLNVWRPRGTAANENLPVLIWIHGGGYTDGGCSRSIYDGTSFANHGIIFVCLNYRLGRFGFFAHPALSAEKAGPLGNYGFQDQLLALKWIRHNISQFGGDPNKMTLMGESAGGGSVVQWLTSSEATGLFQQAIVMSGGGRDYLLGNLPLKKLNPLELDAEQTGTKFAQENSIEGSDAAALEKLRALPASVVAKDISLNEILRRLALPILTYAGGPIIDGETITSLPAEKFRTGNFNKVPLIIGTTSFDLGVEYAASKDELFKKFEDDAELARNFYDPDGTKLLPRLLVEVGADFLMQEPARFVARSFEKAQSPVWMYRFDYVAQSSRVDQFGANHGSDVPFALNTVAARYGDDLASEDEQTAFSMNSYISTFVASGRPAPFTQPEWGQYAETENKILIFNPEPVPSFVVDPLKERLDLVEKYQD